MKKTHFDRLVKSIEEMKKIEAGTAKPSRVYKYPDVKQIREELHVSQKKFSDQLGISDKTLKNWEQKRRTPTGAARVLLCLLEQHPQMVWKLCVKVSASATSSKVPTKRIKSKKSRVST